MVRGGLSGMRASDAQYREGEEPFALALLRIGEDFLYGVKPGRYGPDAPPLHPAYALAPALLRELASCSNGARSCRTRSTSTRGPFQVDTLRQTAAHDLAGTYKRRFDGDSAA